MRGRLFCVLAISLGLNLPVRAATVTVDGSQAYQVMEGFGVNANYYAWSGNELQPVIDALIDGAGMTLCRVIFNNGWEATNDNADPNVMNWSYYNTLYSGPEFQKLWGLLDYLSRKGVTDGVADDPGHASSLIEEFRYPARGMVKGHSVDL